MHTSMIATLLAIGCLLVVGSPLLRVRSNGRYELKTSDLVLLIVPLLLVALATGRIKELGRVGVKADLSELGAAAAHAEIRKQVAPGVPATVLEET